MLCVGVSVWLVLLLGITVVAILGGVVVSVAALEVG